MKPKAIYLLLCFVGVLLPYWQFVPWVLEHGMNLPLFVRELFVNRISAFFGMDVLVSAVVLVAFMRIESGRLSIVDDGFRYWRYCWSGFRSPSRCFCTCGKRDSNSLGP
jgi:Terpene cyclase DEP1